MSVLGETSSILATIIGAVTLALSTHHDYTHKTMKNCMKSVEIFWYLLHNNKGHFNGHD